MSNLQKDHESVSVICYFFYKNSFVCISSQLVFILEQDDEMLLKFPY